MSVAAPGSHQGTKLLLSLCSTTVCGFHPHGLKMAVTLPSNTSTFQVGGRGQIRDFPPVKPLLGKGSFIQGLFSISYWPELCHKATSNHKIGLEFENLTLQPVGEEDKREGGLEWMLIELT